MSNAHQDIKTPVQKSTRGGVSLTRVESPLEMEDWGEEVNGPLSQSPLCHRGVLRRQAKNHLMVRERRNSDSQHVRISRARDDERCGPFLLHLAIWCRQRRPGRSRHLCDGWQASGIRPVLHYPESHLDRHRPQPVARYDTEWCSLPSNTATLKQTRLAWPLLALQQGTWVLD